MSSATSWIIPVSDPTAKTLLESLTSEVSIAQPEMVRRDGRTRTIQFVTKSSTPPSTGILWENAGFDPSSAVAVAIGNNAPPTAGTFELEFNGNSTGLTALAFNITAANLQTALNANPAIVTAGGVTVTKASGFDGSYLVAFVADGAQNLFVIEEGTLSPPSVVNVERVQAGDGDTNEVQRISFKQGYLAYSDDFSGSATGSIDVTVNQAGTTSAASVQTVAISSNVLSGTFTLTGTQQAQYDIVCAPNVAAVAYYTIAVGVLAVGLNSLYIDIFDSAGPVRIWFDLSNGGVAPATPTGGRLVEVNSAADTGVAWLAALNTAFAADANLAIVTPVTASGDTITLASKTLVALADGNENGAPGITITKTQADFGGLDQAGFVITMPSSQSAAVWFNLSAVEAVPDTFATASTLYPITSIAGTRSGIVFTSTGTQVATALAAGVTSLGEFTAATSTVTATMTAVFPIAGTIASTTSLLGCKVKRAGYYILGSFPFNAEAGDFQEVFGAYYRITKTGDSAWQFVALTIGGNATLTATDTNLVFAPVFTGTLVLNTWPMALAFDGTTSDTIDSTLEVQVTEPGGEPIKVLNISVTIRRDVIDGVNLTSAGASSNGANVYFLEAITGYTGGGSTNLDGVTTVGVPVPRFYWFYHATDGMRGYILRAGTDAESSPAYVRPDDYNAGSNAKCWVSAI
jgi:hypothetical protein